jgi:hypothetical protein
MDDKLRNQWLWGASIITVSLVFIYFVLHFLIGDGAENVYLQKDQLAIINTFIVQDDTVCHTNDSLEITPAGGGAGVAKANTNAASPDAGKVRLIKDYILKTVDNLDPKTVDDLFETYCLTQLITVLPYYPFRVKSFFWLVGNKVLLEVTFWSLFGLIASLMYSITMLRRINKYMIREHIGKLFYTPFICIVIYLALNALMNSGSISLTGVGKSVIVLSFILGFFTRRAVLLLDKIKDLILPKTQETIDADNELRNKYPNEIRGKVTASSLGDDDFERMRKSIRITAERNYTGEDKQSIYSITENLSETNTFSFNSLLSGIYVIYCFGILDSQRYECRLTVPMEDTDAPMVLEIDLKKVDDSAPKD